MANEFTRELQATEAYAPTAGRRAALALHTVSGTDRDWVLDRLAPAQRLALLPLLAELQHLEVPVQPHWFRAQGVSAPGSDQGLWDAKPDPSPEVTLLQALHQLTVDDAHALLVDEPDGLIAELLQAGRFDWRTPLLERWPVRRASIERLEQRPAVDGADRRREALLRALAARAPCQVPPPTTPQTAVPTPWSQRAWRWLGGLGSR